MFAHDAVLRNGHCVINNANLSTSVLRTLTCGVDFLKSGHHVTSACCNLDCTMSHDLHFLIQNTTGVALY